MPRELAPCAAILTERRREAAALTPDMPRERQFPTERRREAATLTPFYVGHFSLRDTLFKPL
jgi:hypothetical protein